ncbi:MAG: hypothetical protein DMF77_21085, partial [Acidobacteria bacterium]
QGDAFGGQHGHLRGHQTPNVRAHLAGRSGRGAGRIIVRNYLERCAAAGIKAGREHEVFDEVMDVIFKLTR